MDMKSRWKDIQSRIDQACSRSGRDPRGVTVLAVTKNTDNDGIYEAESLGITEMGENRMQQARQRLRAFPHIRWHFIGPLQTNKVRYCRDFVLIHSLDRWKLAQSLQSRAEKWDKTVHVLIQVNPAGEPQKHGLDIREAPEFIEQVVGQYPLLKVDGLMAMAPFVDDPQEVRPLFREVAKLQNRLQSKGYALPVLSMGMTNDYEVAVEEGATLVRIGSALFREEET